MEEILIKEENNNFLHKYIKLITIVYCEESENQQIYLDSCPAFIKHYVKTNLFNYYKIFFNFIKSNSAYRLCNTLQIKVEKSKLSFYCLKEVFDVSNMVILF